MSSLSTKSPRIVVFIDEYAFGAEIACKLNSAKPSAAVLRVRAIVERLKTHSALLTTLHHGTSNRGRLDETPARKGPGDGVSDQRLRGRDAAALKVELTSLTDELRSRLARYRWRPDVVLTANGELAHTLSSGYIGAESAWENATVHWLLSGLSTVPPVVDAIARFERCDHCGDWFFSRRDGARFCQSSCRVLSYQQSEKGRAERARYMRKLRNQGARRGRKANGDPGGSRSSNTQGPETSE